MARPRLERFGMARKKLRRRKKEASEKEYQRRGRPIVIVGRPLRIGQHWLSCFMGVSQSNNYALE